MVVSNLIYPGAQILVNPMVMEVPVKAEERFLNNLLDVLSGQPDVEQVSIQRWAQTIVQAHSLLIDSVASLFLRIRLRHVQPQAQNVARHTICACHHCREPKAKVGGSLPTWPK